MMDVVSWRLECAEQNGEYLLCIVIDGERRSTFSFPTKSQRDAAEKDFRQMMDKFGSTSVKLN